MGEPAKNRYGYQYLHNHSSEWETREKEALSSADQRRHYNETRGMEGKDQIWEQD